MKEAGMGKQKAVVVVAQDLYFAVRLTEALHAMGFRGVTVQDEAELRDKLVSERPHLVILDLQTCGVQPHSVVAAARQAVPGRVIPVLAYGLHADASGRNAALGAGCQRVVPKSVLTSDLPLLVKNMTHS